MARENMLPNAGMPLLQTYNDFGGGLNTETANEQLTNREYPIFENVDMNGRGSARRRTGRIDALTTMPTGTAQGLFPYFRSGQTNPDLIMAVSGQLYLVYATPKSVTNETPSGSGTTYTLTHPYVQRGSVTVTVNGTNQIFVDDPTVAPSLDGVSGTSNLPQTSVQVGYTLTTSLGESKMSPISTIDISAGEEVRVDVINFPANVTAMNFYVSDGVYSNTLRLQQTITKAGIVMIQAFPATSQPEAPTTSTATAGSINYATGVITFTNTPSAIPSVSYNYEMMTLPISGLAEGFQTTVPIQSAEYQGILYIPTGTKLCQYDGTTVSVCTPYTPTNMEAIYIGLNGLASNPEGYIQDGTQTSGISVVGIGAQYNPGAANQANQMTAYVNKATSITSVDYQWQYKASSETTWTTGLAWAQDSAGKTWTFTPPTAEPYDIQVQARDHNNTSDTSTTYILSGFTVNQTPAKTPPSNSGIETCTQVVVYWDRIMLCGSQTSPTLMYISDLSNPTYYPMTNTIDWDTGNGEGITGIAMFRDELVVFTKTTIQGLQGKDPSTYVRDMIHPSIGCIAGHTIQVVNNDVYFLSAEGLMALEPNMFLTYFNITRNDYQIRSELINELDDSACSLFYDNQYWLCIPSKSLVYRYYFDFKAWVRDTSSALNLLQWVRYGSLVYEITQDAKLRQLDNSVFTDSGEVYTMKVQSKFLAFQQTFDYKKLKRVFVLAKHYSDHNVDISVTVEADGSTILTTQQGVIWIDQNQNTNWETEDIPNFVFNAGSALGSWVLGTTPLGTQEVSVQMQILQAQKCRRTRITFEHTAPNECEIYGFGFEFRLRRPY